MRPDKFTQKMQEALQATQDVAAQFNQQEMAKLKDEFLSAEHYLLALADGKGAAAKLLKDARVTRDKLMQALHQVRGSQRVTDQKPEGKYQTLEKYGRDLTELARKGKI